ncbi:MAG: SusD/RagB family nutrient-binding outer membrane lipoprotein [Bacteroidota bacterium]|nr:SusD/RagB family nutrient-binding outer membrane lipoprotein [Bacteroidota bacterium]
MNKIISIFSIFILLFSFTGCEKSLDELNVNPNEPDYSNPDYLMTYAIVKGMGEYNSDVTLEQWSVMHWNMFLASKNGKEEGKVYEMPSGKESFWREQYTNALSNTQEVINLTENDFYLINKTSIARIWKVFLFHRLTDLWGEIPYSEALKGISDMNRSPKYDTQESIYTDMLNELKEAAALLDADKVTFVASADPVYQGDVLKWQRFANSLRLRLAVRIKNAAPELSNIVIDELENQLLISSNIESATFPFNSQIKNHLYEAEFRGEAFIQNNPSRFLVEMLKNTNDPRIEVILNKAVLSPLPTVDDYTGLDNLLPPTENYWDSFNDEGTDIATIGDWFLRNETPGVVMGYGEVCFLKAEVALADGNSEASQQLFEEGIRADMEFYGSEKITEQEIEDYIQNAGEVNLEKIITQKWLSFVFENGYEAFTEYRRTGYPVLLNYDGEEIDQQPFPKRLTYPVSEQNLNSANYLDAISRQGADAPETSLWWDI